MSIRIILHGKVKDGMVDEFKEVAEGMIAAAREEEGTTTYRWYLSDDGHFMNDDIYTDEAAFFAHLGAATEAGFVEKYTGSIVMGGVLVLDPVNDELKGALEAFGAVHYDMIGGF